MNVKRINIALEVFVGGSMYQRGCERSLFVGLGLSI